MCTMETWAVEPCLKEKTFIIKKKKGQPAKYQQCETHKYIYTIKQCHLQIFEI